jgi:flagellin-like protein
MKANRRVLNADDEGVSPVIAVILMVAITVVLAATVYVWVSGFGTEQGNLVSASFTAKAVDMPLGAGKDADSSDDVIELTYTAGTGDLSLTDVQIFVDGVSLSALAATFHFVEGGSFTNTDLCTTQPGGDADLIWERGGSLYIVDLSGDATGDLSEVTDCTGGPSEAANVLTIAGTHLIKVVVKNQVVLDTTIEVHDSLAA